MGTGAENIALIKRLGGAVAPGACISHNAALLCAEVERLTAAIERARGMLAKKGSVDVRDAYAAIAAKVLAEAVQG